LSHIQKKRDFGEISILMRLQPTPSPASDFSK
jgi:hypothetical protein